MYVADMTLAEAQEWLAELEADPPVGSPANRSVEQWNWDCEDLREHIAELKAGLKA